MKIRIIAAVFSLLVAASLLTGCTSDADTASRNISTAAEQFEINRRVTIIHPITGDVTFEVEGRCSVESAESFLPGALEITCKIGPNEFVKHFEVVGDNGQVNIQQLDTIDASVYHHRVIIKPENILPEFDYEAGEQ